MSFRQPWSLPRSAIHGIDWPPIADADAAPLLAMQHQFDQIQWWDPQAIRSHQLRQASRLVAHAEETVPFYREQWPVRGAAGADSRLSEEAWARLPILQREDLQRHGDALRSTRVPPAHGDVREGMTSGSTGRPIRFCGTGVTRFLWAALTLRDHAWQHRDLGGKLASIRTTVETEAHRSWGPATDAAFDTGPCVTMNIRNDVDVQLDWLAREDPDYLLSHPSNILALADRSGVRGIRLPRLKQVRSFGETLAPGVRRACLQAWNVGVADVYSAEEVGYIALQCPDGEHYHVQAESLLVELLRDDGAPCRPGETGRVVVTSLHNFAMPLIRYAIGDYAEAGAPCSCGRGLPVLARILGRQRNMVTLPDGRRHWPSFPAEAWLSVAPVRQFQLVQRELDWIEARVVADRPITGEEERRLERTLQDYLGYAFRIRFVFLDALERTANCKFEDFISELPRS